jgi:hypothetical protein
MLRFQTDPAKRFYYLLGAITLAGLAFRLKTLGTESLTADEASALLRLQYPDFSSMIENGVRPDGHPAFTQVLLWFWTKAFGLGEFAIRLPFALMGAASIWQSGIIARKWFGDFPAYAVAAGMAFLEFPLMYSQLARPYAPGLFFTLLTAYFFTSFLFGEKTGKRQTAGFAFSAALAAYSHYFSGLAAALMGLFGIFLVPKTNRNLFLVACVGAVLLFIPHIGITLSQLETGGIGGPGGWLGKPTPDFIPGHFLFAFNHSPAILLGAVGIWLGTLMVFLQRPKKTHLLSILLWLLPLVIGYVYSVKRNPVLQDSVLLFGFPFLLLFLFAWLPPVEKHKSAPLFPAIAVLGFFYFTSVYKPFRLTDHFGRLKELVSTAIETQEKYGVGKVLVAYDVDAPYFVQYYYDQYGEQHKNVITTILPDPNALLSFRKKVENSTADYFVYGWSTRYSPVEVPEIIRETYPYLVKRELWFNSAVYVFSRNPSPDYIRENRDIIFDATDNFEPQDTSAYEMTVTGPEGKPVPVANWSAPCGRLFTDTLVHPMHPDTSSVNGPVTYMWSAPPDYWIRLDSTCTYSPSLRMKVGDILPGPDNQLLLSASVKFPDTLATGVLVIQFERDGKQLYWNGRETSTQADRKKAGEWQTIFFGLQPPPGLHKTDTVVVFFYTKDSRPILLNQLNFRVLTGHPGIYGERGNYE